MSAADLDELERRARDFATMLFSTRGMVAALIAEHRDAIRVLAEAREALVRHVEVYGGPDHHPEDCLEVGPGACPECDISALVESALRNIDSLLDAARKDGGA